MLSRTMGPPFSKSKLIGGQIVDIRASQLIFVAMPSSILLRVLPMCDCPTEFACLLGSPFWGDLAALGVVQVGSGVSQVANSLCNHVNDGIRKP